MNENYFRKIFNRLLRNEFTIKDYAIPYQSSGKPVVKIGIAFSQETKTVSDWTIKQ